MEFTGLNNIYYCTSDRSYGLIAKYLGGLMPKDKQDITYIAVAGGLDVLNHLPIINPSRLIIFDKNEHQIAYFSLIRRIWLNCNNRHQFIERLTSGEYLVHTEAEAAMRTNIIRKLNGETVTGRSRKPFQVGWVYALRQYANVKRALSKDIWIINCDINDDILKKTINHSPKPWVFLSNIFHFNQNTAVYSFGDWDNARVTTTFDTVVYDLGSKLQFSNRGLRPIPEFDNTHKLYMAKNNVYIC